MAALRGGIKTVLIPKENEKDLVEIPKNVKQGLDIRPVQWIEEVLEMALVNQPEPHGDEDVSVEKPVAGKHRESKKSAVIKH